MNWTERRGKFFKNPVHISSSQSIYITTTVIVVLGSNWPTEVEMLVLYPNLVRIPPVRPGRRGVTKSRPELEEK